MTERLVLLAKRPRKGFVKTRLASTLGEDKAYQIYCELLERTLHTMDSTSYPVSVFLSGIGSIDLPKKFEVFEQTEGNIGDRMQHAIQLSLQSSDSVVLVGSDIPALSSSILQEAFIALKEKDVVLGPSADGGYYLIGMKVPQPSLFQSISWSTEQVLEETLQCCNKLGLTVHLVDTLNDIDTEEDWLEFKALHHKD